MDKAFDGEVADLVYLQKVIELSLNHNKPKLLLDMQGMLGRPFGGALVKI